MANYKLCKTCKNCRPVVKSSIYVINHVTYSGAYCSDPVCQYNMTPRIVSRGIEQCPKYKTYTNENFKRKKNR